MTCRGRLEGKVVVVVNGAPPGVDRAPPRLESQVAISRAAPAILPARPAAVVILLAGKGTGDASSRAVPAYMTGRQPARMPHGLTESERLIP